MPAEVFIVAATVEINATKGMVQGSTASARWRQQRRMPLGSRGSLGVAEDPIVADANDLHRSSPASSCIEHAPGREWGATRWGVPASWLSVFPREFRR